MLKFMSDTHSIAQRNRKCTI